MDGINETVNELPRVSFLDKHRRQGNPEDRRSDAPTLLRATAPVTRQNESGQKPTPGWHKRQSQEKQAEGEEEGVEFRIRREHKESRNVFFSFATV